MELSPNIGRVAAAAAALIFISSVRAQTDVVTNGQFASGLAGWSQGVSTAGSASGTCGYNVGPAPGIEALTGAPGFPATGGATNIALGSVSLTAAGARTCVLYQDIAIPAGATTAVIQLDQGVKVLGGISGGDTATFVGLYSTTSVPSFQSSTLVTGFIGVVGTAAGPTLVTQTSPTLNVAAVAGTTVRLAILNVIQSPGGGTLPPIPGAAAVIGLLNLHVSVTVVLPTVTGLSPSSGPPAGGTPVTITGTGFTGATAVNFGAAPATSFNVVNATTITAISPPAGGPVTASPPPGSVNVTVTTPFGTSAPGAATLFTYSSTPPSGVPTLGVWATTTLALLLAGVCYVSLRRYNLTDN
jgi:hypothetical protein